MQIFLMDAGMTKRDQTNGVGNTGESHPTDGGNMHIIYQLFSQIQIDTTAETHHLCVPLLNKTMTKVG